MSVQYPYRAVIFGEEHIIKGWRNRKLITNKGSFSVRHIYGDWPIQNCRVFEVSAIQSDGQGGWLVNGKPLSLLESLHYGVRLNDIPCDENLRVYQDKIRAVAFVQKAVSQYHDVTGLLDQILNFWKTAALKPITSDDKDSGRDIATTDATTQEILTEIESYGEAQNRLLRQAANTLVYANISEIWSNPVWLTEFRPVGQKIPLTPEQKRLAKTTAELQATKAQLQKAQSAAGNTLKEALSEWMRFDPPRMSADTKARIEKAVKMYLTDPEKRSLAKIADEFKVTPKTVSVWFKKFTEVTGFQVVTFKRHESVKEHLRANSKPAEDEEGFSESDRRNGLADEF